MCNLEHRGAEGAEPKTEMELVLKFLFQINFSVKFFHFLLPPLGSMLLECSFTKDPLIREGVETIIEKVIIDEEYALPWI